MHHRARRRVLLTIALLAFLPLEGRASFFQQRSGRQRILEKEIHYRVTGPADADWQTAYASSGWVGQDSVAFNPPRGQIHLWARFTAPAVSEPVRYFLHSSPWERVEIFVIRNGRLVDRQLTGTLVPAAERSMHISMTPLFSHSGFVRLELVPDSTTEVLARLGRVFKLDLLV